MTLHAARQAGAGLAVAGLVALAVLAACEDVPLPTETIPTSPRLAPSVTELPPTLTEAPTPHVVLGCVTAGSLRVRSGPSKEFPVIGGLKSGDCLPLSMQSSSGEWLMIEATSWAAGGIGWVYGGYLAIQGDIALLATSSPLGITEARSTPDYTPTPPRAVATLRPTDTRWPTATRTRVPPTPTRRRPTPASTRWPTATTGPTGGGGGGGGGGYANCHPSYAGVCLLIGAGDYDCAGGSGNGPNYVRGPVRVVGYDEFGLDRDGDGWGCE